MKLYSAYYSGGYPFEQLSFIDETITITEPDEITEEGVLVLWGGEDISPAIYNKPRSQHTGARDVLSRRDLMEVALAKRAIERGMPIIGVCRGAQMLCGLAGGHLIQHVRHHGGRHTVTTFDGKKIQTNSIHHQMMYPFNVKHELRAWLPHPLSDIHVDVQDNGDEFDRKDMAVEPECVYFPEIKGHAVQWHPEMMQPNSEANAWFLNTLEKDIGNVSHM